MDGRLCRHSRGKREGEEEPVNKHQIELVCGTMSVLTRGKLSGCCSDGNRES